MRSASLGLGRTVGIFHELSIDDVRQMTLWAPKGLSPTLALGTPAFHIGPASRIDLSLDQRNRVDGAIQASVPAAIEPVPADAPRRGPNWGGSCRRYEVILRGEPTNIAHLGKNPSGA